MENVVEITAKTVYDFTGSPSPDFLDKVLDILLNENIAEAYLMVSSLLKEGVIAL